MPPAGIDMNLIKEALMQRMQGGGGTPAVGQMSQPGGALPTGGQNTPTQQPPQTGQPQMQPRTMSAPGGGAGGGDAAAALKAATGANSPSFDDETRLTAKALVAKLLKVL